MKIGTNTYYDILMVFFDRATKNYDVIADVSTYSAKNIFSPKKVKIIYHWKDNFMLSNFFA